MLDIKITNAKPRNTGKELVEIGIENGKITAIASAVEGEAKQVIDAKGNLVTESFVNGHLHLCKVYTLEMAGQLISQPDIKKKNAKACALLEEGALLENALSDSELFQGMDARLITVGLRAGSADEVMNRLAQRYRDSSLTVTGNLISIVEPTIVIIFSVLIGLVLLSVMMPLLGILSDIAI